MEKESRKSQTSMIRPSSSYSSSSPSYWWDVELESLCYHPPSRSKQSSKSTLNRLKSRMFSGTVLDIVLGNSMHGWKTVSTANLIVFSIICGINLSKHCELSSKHGFVLTSMSHGLNLLSIIKSSPKTSNPNSSPETLILG